MIEAPGRRWVEPWFTKSREDKSTMNTCNEDTLHEEFRDLFEEAPIPYVHEAMDSRFIRMNRAARELLGVRAEAVGATFGLALVVDSLDNKQQLDEALASIREGRETHGLLLEMRRKDDGKRLWVEWSTKPSPDRSYTRTMLVDVSNRVLLEQAKAALEFSLESGQIGEWDLDLINDVSRRSLRHDMCFGYTAPVSDDQWGAEAFFRHVHAEDRNHVERTMSEAVAALRDWSAEFRVVWSDGSVHWLVAKGNIYRTTAEGQAARMLGVVMDITDRKRSEEALAASERLARGQVDALTRTIEALAMESVPDRLLEHVLGTITAQLGAHSCSVWHKSDADGRVHFESSYENGRLFTPSDPSLTAAKLALPIVDSPLWSKVFRSGSTVIVKDICELRDFPWRARLIELGVVTMLVIPMSVGNQVDGAVGIRFTSQRSFKAQEIELAQALVNQATLSMQLTKLSAQSREAAVIAERNRMARDIHDTLAQGLTGVIVQLEAAADAQARGLTRETDTHIARASGMARESLTEARRSVRALRPMELDDGDLCEALESLIRKMTAGTPVNAAFVREGTPAKLPSEWEDNLLRAVKEVLTNVLRHSNASDFSARIAFRSSEVKLDLRDNGCGFDPDGKFDGFGLLGVHERVATMRGRLSLKSRLGQGTHYSISVPLDPGPLVAR